MAKNLDSWLTKEDAAAALGVSARTVMRMADAKKIQQQLRPRAGGSPLAVYNPADIERMVAERTAVEPFVMPAAGAKVAGKPERLPAVRTGALMPAAFVEQLSLAIASRKPAASEKVRVSMGEAVQLGFSRDYLRGLMAKGELANVGTARRYRFRRRDLDAL